MCFEENKEVEKSENMWELVRSLFELINEYSDGTIIDLYMADLDIDINFVNKMEAILEKIKKTIVAEEVANEKEIRELSERLEELNLQIREDGINAKSEDIDEMTDIIKQIKQLKQ